jgi:hypothetical protein
MKNYDPYIADVIPIWMGILGEEGPPEIVEKLSEEELQALSEFIARTTFKMHVGAMSQGYQMAQMDDLLERDSVKAWET